LKSEESNVADIFPVVSTQASSNGNGSLTVSAVLSRLMAKCTIKSRSPHKYRRDNHSHQKGPSLPLYWEVFFSLSNEEE
jgi:hypothetical protein